MTATAYPLAWPDGWTRTPSHLQQTGDHFKQGSRMYGENVTTVTLDVARKKLFAELDRMVGVQYVVLSTNVPLRSDGMPRVDAARYRIDDPGVAIYFHLHNRPMAMACDRYFSVAANVRSLGLAIEALRQLERHGGVMMMERAFSGFTALPPPRTCWDVLGLQPGASVDVITGAWRKLASLNHPDRGGDETKMAEINAARDEALREGRVMPAVSRG